MRREKKRKPKTKNPRQFRRLYKLTYRKPAEPEGKSIGWGLLTDLKGLHITLSDWSGQIPRYGYSFPMCLTTAGFATWGKRQHENDHIDKPRLKIDSTLFWEIISMNLAPRRLFDLDHAILNRWSQAYLIRPT